MTLPSEVLVAHQPAYLPWPGFFSRLADVNRLVLLDHVQYTEGGWQNRNFVSDRRGTPIRMTVPVRRGFGQRLHDVRIAEATWARRHWRTLVQSYGRTRFWPRWEDRLHAIYHQPWQRLVDLNEALIHLLLEGFGMKVRVLRSSTLGLGNAKTQMLIELCRQTQTRVLRVGTGAARYLNATELTAAGIEVEIATYIPPIETRRCRAGGPVPSALDLLLHHGDRAIEELRAGAQTHPWVPVEAVHS